ncbi:MAG: EamA family transporter [Fibrobacter sp.]|nr:EamA family transporter [Fibrobacter sp.]
MEYQSTMVCRPTPVKGILFGCLSGICYGTNPLGALNLYKMGLDPETILCYRFAFAVVMLGLILFFKDGIPTAEKIRSRFALNRREFGFLTLLGFLFALCAYGLFASFKYMEAGLASTLLFLFPLEVAIIMAVFFKERVSLKTGVSIAVSLLGLACLYRGGDGGVALSAIGLSLVALASVSYSYYIVVVNKANLKMGSLKLTFFAMLFCLMFLLAYSALFGAGIPGLPKNSAVWGWSFMLGLVPTVLSLVFMAKATKMVGSTPTAITGAFEPLTAVVIGVSVFGEVLTMRLVCGITLILGAVVLLAIKK